MMPQIEKTYPAGVISVTFLSDTCAVSWPPIVVVLPARPLMIIVMMKAMMFKNL